MKEKEWCQAEHKGAVVLILKMDAVPVIELWAQRREGPHISDWYCISMDQQWMYKDQRSMKFFNGLLVFLVTAEETKKPSRFISSPDIDCKNKMEYSSWRALHEHLMRRRFMSCYVCWTKHGELGVLEGENEEEEDGNIDFA
ncbi:hypothetical protein U9M48_000425 [Paspalum notatum var. saurae]|uniref:Transposase-associated domain-containing protein n=1 Tax=Paspalum notatum var. saurae TaxID=547442 RepID=A0AAQ3SCD4_PASNO